MFSDGHVGRFSRQSNAERPKNITALVAPAIGCMSLSVGFCALSAFVTSYSDPPVEEPSGFWMYWDTFWGALILISLIVAAIGFIPLPLPKWMYPPYHEAKREERRRREADEHKGGRDGLRRLMATHPAIRCAMSHPTNDDKLGLLLGMDVQRK